jgi:hypothetical protein
LIKRFIPAALSIAVLGPTSGVALAADMFKLRYPVQGNLSHEMVTPVPEPGFAATLSAFQVEVDKITGADGTPRSLTIPGPDALAIGVAAAAITGAQAAALSPAMIPGSKAEIKFSQFKQSQSMVAASIAYTFADMVNGGRVTLTAGLPYANADRSTVFTPSGSGAAAPSANGVLLQLATSSAAGLQNANNTSASGQGDMDLNIAWNYRKDNYKLIAAGTLVLPTADYNKDFGGTVKGLNLGAGNMSTMRLSVALSAQATENLVLGYRVLYGTNARNKDNDIKSGSFLGVDLAALYRTPIGYIGPQYIYLNQFNADSYGPRSGLAVYNGSNEYSSSSGGVAFTTLLEPLKAQLHVSYMQTFESKNAQSGSVAMVRLARKF